MGALIVILLAVVLTQLGGADDHDVPPVAAPATSAEAEPAATTAEAEAAPTTDSTPERQQTKADDSGDDSSEPKDTAGEPGTGNRGVPGGDQADGGNSRTGEIKVDIADGTFSCVRMPANPQLLSNLELTKCTGRADQQWTRTSWEGFQQGDLCMDMGPDNEKPGENRTRVFPCNETDTQIFYWEKSGRLSNPNGLCLGVGDSEEGFVLTMVECNNDILRPWKIPS
ncbi:MAG: RICIN domain-containing protein [Actinoplanes sp.]